MVNNNSKQENKKRTCKIRKVRINSDGTPNEEDMEHNRKCELKYIFIDNPWMKPLLKEKNPKGYNKDLKEMVKKRIKDLKTKSKGKPKVTKKTKSKGKPKVTKKTKSKSKSKVVKKSKSKSKSKVVKKSKSKGRKKVQKGGDLERVDFELVNKPTDYNISKGEDIKFKCLGVDKDRSGTNYDTPPQPFVINSEYILTGPNFTRPKFPLDHGDLKKEYELSDNKVILVGFDHACFKNQINKYGKCKISVLVKKQQGSSNLNGGAKKSKTTVIKNTKTKSKSKTKIVKKKKTKSKSKTIIIKKKKTKSK